MAKRIAPSNDDLMSEILGQAVGGVRTLQDEREAEPEPKAAKAPAAAPADRPGAPIAPDKEALAENLKGPAMGSKTINVKVSKQAHAAFKAASAIEGLQYSELLEKLLRDAYPYLFTR